MLEVALHSGGRPDLDRLIRHADVKRVGVGRRVDRDSLDVELVQRADHAHGDLAAVRNEDAAEHQRTGGGAIGSSSKRSCPNSTGWPFSTWIAVTRPAFSA